MTWHPREATTSWYVLWSKPGEEDPIDQPYEASRVEIGPAGECTVYDRTTDEIYAIHAPGTWHLVSRVFQGPNGDPGDV